MQQNIANVLSSLSSASIELYMMGTWVQVLKEECALDYIKNNPLSVLPWLSEKMEANVAKLSKYIRDDAPDNLYELNISERINTAEALKSAS